MEAGEYFGELQRAITLEWRKHLETDRRSVHMILDEFYKEMPEKVDALIEAWQADHDNVTDWGTCIEADDMDATAYLQELKRVAKQASEELLDSSELKSLNDDVLAQIDTALYKMKKLTKQNESLKSLQDYLTEALNDVEA